MRDAGVRTDLTVHKVNKVKKILAKADRDGIPNVVFIGEREVEEGRFTVRNMEGGGEVEFDVEIEEGEARRYFLGEE